MFQAVLKASVMLQGHRPPRREGAIRFPLGLEGRSMSARSEEPRPASNRPAGCLADQQAPHSASDFLVELAHSAPADRRQLVPATARGIPAVLKSFAIIQGHYPPEEGRAPSPRCSPVAPQEAVARRIALCGQIPPLPGR